MRIAVIISGLKRDSVDYNLQIINNWRQRLSNHNITFFIHMWYKENENLQDFEQVLAPHSETIIMEPNPEAKSKPMDNSAHVWPMLVGIKRSIEITSESKIEFDLYIRTRLDLDVDFASWDFLQTIDDKTVVTAPNYWGMSYNDHLLIGKPESLKSIYMVDENTLSNIISQNHNAEFSNAQLIYNAGKYVKIISASRYRLRNWGSRIHV